MSDELPKKPKPKPNPRPTRIPEQKQITPEMEEKLRQRALAKEASFRKRAFYRKVVITLLIIGLPAAIILYTSTSDRTENKNGNSSEELLSDFDRILVEGNSDQLTNYLLELDNLYRIASLPIKITILDQKTKIAERLIELDEDVASRNFGIIAKLKILMTQDSNKVNLGIEQQGVRAELLSLSSQHLENPDPDVRGMACRGLFLARMFEYVEDNTEDKFKIVTNTLDDEFSDFTSHFDSAPQYLNLIALLSLAKQEEHIRQFKMLVGKKLKGSHEQHLVEIGKSIHDEMIVGNIDFVNLQRLVLVPDQQALEELTTIVDQISESPDASSSLYRDALAVVESLGQVDKVELQNRLFAKLVDSLSSIADKPIHEQVAQLIEDYRTRQSLLGTSFDLGSTLLPIDGAAEEDIRAIVIFYFTTSTIHSKNWLATLSKTKKYLSKPDVQIVLVCTDDGLTPEFEELIQANFAEDALVTHPENKHFLNQCPVETPPYLLILDKDRNVIAANVNIFRLRSRLEIPE